MTSMDPVEPRSNASASGIDKGKTPGRGQIKDPCQQVPNQYHQSMFMNGHVRCPRCRTVLSATGPREPLVCPPASHESRPISKPKQEAETIRTCGDCGGRGRIEHLRDDLSPPRRITEICEPCNGTGVLEDDP